MKNFTYKCRSLFLVSLFLLLTWTVSAQNVQVEIIDKPAPILDVDGSKNLKRETSAVVPIDDEGKFLLVADDESKALLVIDAQTGQIKQLSQPLEIPGSKKGKWEGLARDEEKNYYVVGSHSVKKTDMDADVNEKLKNRSRLYRFRLEMTGSDISTVKIVNAVEWSILDSLKTEGYASTRDENMVKIEGLTIRTIFTADKKIAKRELIVGLREPVSPVRVLTADITIPPAAGAKLTMTRLFTFDAGTLPLSGTGKIDLRLSSVEYVPAWQGFLILTSTEDENNGFHGNAMWFLRDSKITGQMPVVPEKIMIFSADSKAEGICLFPDRNNSEKMMRFALVYDNDAIKPSLLQYITLAR